MSFRESKYSGYYLVPDKDHGNYYDDYEAVKDEHPAKMRCSWRRFALIFMCVFILFLVANLLIFVILPMAVMFSFNLQSTLIFTHFGLHTAPDYYENYYYPAFKNHYVNVRDLNGSNVTLGVWHILPIALAEQALKDKEFDFENALRYSDYDVLIYFHGTGEDRSDNTRKYQLLSQFFHVIAFDYRGYGDSSKGQLTEQAVESDCMQLYEWVLSKTNASIYVWGHSLGSAIAAGTVSGLKQKDISPKGLILESAFTSLEDELYVHPYGKIFSWLPWFKFTILQPLKRNGFIFDTASNVKNINSSIMILHAEDDSLVPWKFGEKLFEIAASKPNRYAIFHKFPGHEKHDHNFIYQDPYLVFYIKEFLQ